MEHGLDLVPRTAADLVSEALTDTRVVTLNGARQADLAGLRYLADRLGSRFVAGYVLYTGQQTLPFGDRLRAMPMDALWHLAP